MSDDPRTAFTPTGKRQRLTAAAETRLSGLASAPETAITGRHVVASAALAWSEDADAPDYTPWVEDTAELLDAPTDDGRRPLSNALLMFLSAVCAAAVGVAVVLISWQAYQSAPRPTLDEFGYAATPAVDDVPAAPPSAAPVAQPAPAPAPAQHVQTDDEFFEQSITTDGSNPPITDMTAAIAQAHALCTYLEASPRTQSDLYQYSRDVWPAWTARQSGSFVGSAIDAYCGQYINLPG